jgi:prostamide/prostaglandin F2alpha synthase
VQLHRAREEFDVAGANLVLIGQATPRDAARFRQKMKIELPVLADEDRVSYKAIGAKKGSIGELVGPRMLAKGVAASARNRVVQGLTVGSTTQLGAAMVIAPGGHVTWSHLAADASDNASPEQLLAAVREAV